VEKGGTGKGGDEMGGRGGARQDNQYQGRGDREAMREEATDPTYNLADMVIGDLSYLKLILNQNESTEDELWG
jgi:hypothetical protein